MIDFVHSTWIIPIAFRARAIGVAAVLAAISVLGAALLAPAVAGASEGSGAAAGEGTSAEATGDSQTRHEEREADPEPADAAAGAAGSDAQSDAEQGDVPSTSEATQDKSSAADADRDEAGQPPSRSEGDESGQTNGDSASGDDAAVGSGDDATRESSNDRQAGEGSSSETGGDSLRDSIRRRVDEQTGGIARRARERSQAARERAREAVDDRLSGRSDDATPSDSNRRSRDRTTIAVAAEPGEVRLLPGRRDVLVRRRALVRGYIPIGRPGRVVVLEVMRRDGSWGEVDRTRTIEGGKFYLAWFPSRPGYFRVRARPVNPAAGRPSRARLLYIYRTAVASWYGPGFYGNRTACGQTFTNRLLGVAHRSLPCGYRLTVRYGDRAITVRVVDRGPFVPGRDYDLTEATRNYLGFDGVDEIWATA